MSTTRFCTATKPTFEAGRMKYIHCTNHAIEQSYFSSPLCESHYKAKREAYADREESARRDLEFD